MQTDSKPVQTEENIAPSHRKPLQARSRRTYDSLLDSASSLLQEIGVEKISANAICQHAGVTPPAFYRYFDDKYAIIEALADRLGERQAIILEAWVIQYGGQGLDVIAAKVTELLLQLHKVTASEPGALWIQRALHAMPKLAHLRLAAHHRVTDLLASIYAPYLPHVPYEILRRRTRLSVEIAYSLDEMLHEGEAEPESMYADAEHVFSAMFHYPDYRRG